MSRIMSSLAVNIDYYDGPIPKLRRFAMSSGKVVYGWGFGTDEPTLWFRTDQLNEIVRVFAAAFHEEVAITEKILTTAQEPS